ncbi:hypothetical protein BGZ73_006104 [Actinomortierella ambigua]|nr:hypothetical protein BGZ73_006104 [Actinomortierella ambigua]
MRLSVASLDLKQIARRTIIQAQFLNGLTKIYHDDGALQLLPCYAAKHKKVTLDTAIPRYGHKGSVTPAGTILTSPLEFLEKFHTQAKNIYGTQLDAICSQLLVLAMMDDTQQRRLEREFQQLGGIVILKARLDGLCTTKNAGLS